MEENGSMLELNRQQHEKIMRLRKDLASLTQGIKPTANDSLMREIEEADLAALREFIGTFLIGRELVHTPLNVWNLIEPYLTEEMRQNPRVNEARQCLTNPLDGSPTQIVGKSKILQPDHPLRLSEQQIRSNFGPAQNLCLAKVLDRI